MDTLFRELSSPFTQSKEAQEAPDSSWRGVFNCHTGHRGRAGVPGHSFNRIVIVWLMAMEQRNSSGNLPSIKADTQEVFMSPETAC